MAIILDIEASGLSEESYPIEVAWMHTKQHRWCDEFLIEPAQGWDFWSEKSAKVHNIPREDLFSSGICVEAAATRLNLNLSQFGKVYVTSVQYDTFWLDRLFNAAKIERKFAVLDYMDLIPREGFDYEAFHGELIQPMPHGAMADVHVLVSALNKGNKHFL